MPSPTKENRDKTEPGLTRNPTQIVPGRPSPGVGIGGPVRGLSIRKPADTGPSAGPSAAGPTPPPKGRDIVTCHSKIVLTSELLAPKDKDTRLTEFYDDYLDSYADSASAPAVPKLPITGSNDRVAAWARGSANAPPPAISRNGSRSAPGSSYAPSSFGSMRRRPSRRPTQRGLGRMQSTYEEEEEEGYVSGEYDDGFYDLMKIRVKVCNLPQI